MKYIIAITAVIGAILAMLAGSHTDTTAIILQGGAGILMMLPAVVYSKRKWESEEDL